MRVLPPLRSKGNDKAPAFQGAFVDVKDASLNGVSTLYKERAMMTILVREGLLLLLGRTIS